MIFSRKFSEKTLEFQLSTVVGRKIRYETTFQLWMEKPVFGSGYGTFSRKYREKHAYRFAHEPNFTKREDYYDHPHNEILFDQQDLDLSIH